jgi:heparin/heparan-sulfate lyase
VGIVPWRVAGALAVLSGLTILASAGLALAAAPSLGGDQAPAGDWLVKVSSKHPRMFLTAESLPVVREYTLTHEKDYYEAMKRRVAAMPDTADAATFERGANVKYGPYAQQAAFVWLMEQDRAALAKARNYVLEGVRFYLRRSGAGRSVNWYSADRVCALTAYDWIFDELTAAERREIALGFFRHYKEDMAFNSDDYKTGFYGSPNLAWYVGLAFYKDGIDDDQATKLLKQGYDEHLALLRYRSAAAGDDGGMGSVATGYGFGMYPFSEFNFMHTFDSATGLAIEKEFSHLSLFPNWVYWNRLPNDLRYGLADSVPAGKEGDGFLGMHMLEIAHFWAGDYPDRAGLAMWIRDKILRDRTHDDYWWPLAPLLVTRCGELPAPVDPQAGLPHARNFETMGVVFMRSGSSASDVYAAFVAGGNVNQHRHYDQGHFIIYRGGFLAIDSGDYGPRDRNDHLTEYLYRSVAHNCVLIHAPAAADTPAKVWGGPGSTLDGGQCEFAGKQIAFETNAAYSYAATDATRCYAAAKCKEAIRQFVFVYPDTFVICDRVTATDPEYAKSWVLHTVGEPEVAADGRSFRSEQGAGALVCCTVLPGDAKLEKVGGKGKEFWSAGVNHPQAGAFKELAGAWRVEVSPAASRAVDLFVHVIRVGDKSLKDAGSVEAAEIAERGRAGVRIKTERGEAQVIFDAAGDPGGHITLTGQQKVDQELTRQLQPQVGLAAGTP